ncbi:hypothetical protein R2F25_08780 [Streptomyces sp. UP1A-1]|nr:hypothetical protein [Streptomyces sp. UP1A-1]
MDALLAYPLMSDPAERQTVVAALDPRFTGTLPRHTKARTDATGILNWLVRRRPQALWELYDAVVAVDDDPALGRELAEAIRVLAESAGRAHRG